MKECFKCGIQKPAESFYKHVGMQDGRLNKCIDCVKKDVAKRYNLLKSTPDFVYKERKRGRDKHRRLYSGKGSSNLASSLAWSKKYPEKKRASLSCRKLPRPFLGAEAHHWSYNNEHFKDVIWLTKKEHMKAHRFIIYDQDFNMYRRFDTNELLLDKDTHSRFIKDCILNMED